MTRISPFRPVAHTPAACRAARQAGGTPGYSRGYRDGFGRRPRDRAQRDELPAQAAQHDVLAAAFTPDGHVTYDIAARPFFTFRFELSGRTADDLGPAAGRAEARARDWLTERGYAFKNLTVRAQDLSDMPLGKRGRRRAAAS